MSPPSPSRVCRSLSAVLLLYVFSAGPALAQARRSDGSASVTQSASVTTSKYDYAPGETVVITGTAWQAGETVILSLQESPPIDSHGPFTSVADANGHFVNTDFATNAQDLGVTFTLTATGQSSRL